MENLVRMLINKSQLILLLSLMLTGCGTTSKVVYQTPSSEDVTVNNHIKNNNILSLIDDAAVYSEKRTTIIDFLSEKSEMGDLTYSLLMQCISRARNDSTILALFTDAKDIYEESVLSSLAPLSIEEVIKYYKTHEVEHPFIRPVIESSILAEIKDADYYLLRHYHELFCDTDISYCIDTLYNTKREEVWDVQSQALDEYFDAESSILNASCNKAYKEMCEIAESSIPYIMERSIESIESGIVDFLFFKAELSNNTLKDRVKIIVDSVLSVAVIDSLFRNAMVNCFETMYPNRNELAKQIILRDGIDIPELPYLLEFNPFTPFLVPQNSLDAIDTIKSKIRKKQNIVSLTSTALGFIPGIGWVADLALGGTDILFSIFSSKKEANEVSKLLETFANDLYVELIKQISEQSENIFKAYQNFLNYTQSSYKTAIYEQL